jgi:Do/DeqQ family serine protease
MKTISIAAGCAALVAVGVYAFPALTADRKGAADKALEIQKLAPSAPKSLPSVPQSMGQVQLSFAPVVKRVAPAVVNVYSKTIVQAQANPFFNDPLFGQLFGTPEMRQRVQQSLGSGVIVRADGVIITNNHVVEGGSEITVALSDKREFKAKVLLADPRTDLAVLKIDTKGERLPVVPFADSDQVAVGDLVLAIGDPFNVGQTVTMGIVSALARSQVATGDSQIFIQTDAAINPGNSGGALVTTDGKLAGINTAIYSRSGGSIGIGFAIPANLARRVVEGVEGGLKNGATASVQLAWVGASGQPVTSDIAASLGLAKPGGVLIKEVYPGGPLSKAGVKPGEVVQTVDGVAVDDMQSLNYRTATHRAGESVKMHIAAGKAGRDVNVTLVLPPESPPREVATIAGRNPLTGARIENVSPATAIELQLDVMTKGVAIVSVGPNGFAARYNFQPGDIIRSLNGASINRTGELVRALNGTNHWDIVVERGGRRLSLSVEG